MIEVNLVAEHKHHLFKRIDQDNSGDLAFSELIGAFDKTGKGACCSKISNALTRTVIASWTAPS